MNALLLVLWVALAQPGECNDRSPGLSKCVEYTPRTMDAGKVTDWNCVAVCYYGKRSDGGTYSKILNEHAPTQPACLQRLQDACK